MRALGNAPNSQGDDWTILVRKAGPAGPNQPPSVSITEAEPVASTDGVFQEQNGLILFELESQPATDGWQLQDSVPGFTGDGYFRWEGPDLFGSPGTQGVTQYKFNVTNAGAYQMRFHNHRDGGIPFDQENDIWARMDKRARGSRSSPERKGQWNWVSQFDFGEGNRPSASYQLSPGEHTFTIAGRSNGFRVDRVALYNTALTSSAVAQDLNTPTSPTVGGQGGELTFDLQSFVSDDGQNQPIPQLWWTLDEGPGTAGLQ